MSMPEVAKDTRGFRFLLIISYLLTLPLINYLVCLFQEIADNQEMADVLAGLYKGGQTKQICQFKTDHGDVRIS